MTDDDGHTDRRTVIIRVSPDAPVTDLAADAVTRRARASWTAAPASAPTGSACTATARRSRRRSTRTTSTPPTSPTATISTRSRRCSHRATRGRRPTPSPCGSTARRRRRPPTSSADSPTSTAPDLTWSPADDPGSGVATYVVLRDGVEIGRTQHAGVRRRRRHRGRRLRVHGARCRRGRNIGASTPALAVEIDTHPPGAPGGIAGPTPTATVPALTWSPVAGTTEYRVYRGATMVAATGDAAYVDTGVAEGRYTYYVSAVDAIGNESALSSPHTVVYDATPPSTPQAPTATESDRLADRADVAGGGRRQRGRRLRRAPRRRARGQRSQHRRGSTRRRPRGRIPTPSAPSTAPGTGAG